MNQLELTDFELATTAKGMDIHRQSLIKKLDRIGSNPVERKNTLDEIEACSAISRKARHLDDKRLKAVAG
jgi:hypothetical protein